MTILFIIELLLVFYEMKHIVHHQDQTRCFSPQFSLRNSFELLCSRFTNYMPLIVKVEILLHQRLKKYSDWVLSRGIEFFFIGVKGFFILAATSIFLFFLDR
jgi:hypothetical protein